jgi:hypothetical protein
MKTKNCFYCNAREGELHKKDCKIGTKAGRPHFYRTFYCDRCGQERPKIFMVPNKEWKQVTMYYYNSTGVLCKKCFNYVKKTKEKWKTKGINMFRSDVNKRFFKKYLSKRKGASRKG